MKQLVFLIFCCFVMNFAHCQIIHKRKLVMLTSPFEMTVVAKDTVEGNLYIDAAIAEVGRIEHLISDWIPTTPISIINQNAGIAPIKVDEELFELLKRSVKMSKVTDGAFRMLQWIKSGNLMAA